jgi:ABC-2 type transport system permease protein
MRHAQRAGRASHRGALAAEWVSMREALHAEWTKLRTVPGPGWLLLASVVLTVAVSASVTATVRCQLPAACTQDTARVSLTGIVAGQAAIAILAVLVMSGEYSTGMIRATMAAIPRRPAILAAKAAVVTTATLAAGVIAVSGSLLTGRLILPRHGFTPAHGYPLLSLAEGPVLRAAAGSVLYLALIALLSLGVATAIRDSAAAISAVLGLLYLFPVISALVTDPSWRQRIGQLAPMIAGLAIQATRNPGRLPIGPWAGLGVLAAWAAAALLTGGLLFWQRDA